MDEVDVDRKPVERVQARLAVGEDRLRAAVWNPPPPSRRMPPFVTIRARASAPHERSPRANSRSLWPRSPGPSPYVRAESNTVTPARAAAAIVSSASSSSRSAAVDRRMQPRPMRDSDACSQDGRLRQAAYATRHKPSERTVVGAQGRHYGEAASTPLRFSAAKPTRQGEKTNAERIPPRGGARCGRGRRAGARRRPGVRTLLLEVGLERQGAGARREVARMDDVGRRARVRRVHGRGGRDLPGRCGQPGRADRVAARRTPCSRARACSPGGRCTTARATRRSTSTTSTSTTAFGLCGPRLRRQSTGARHEPGPAPLRAAGARTRLPT